MKNISELNHSNTQPLKEKIDFLLKLKNAIAIEKIDTNLYKSKESWAPNGGIGAFGGQLVAQSLNAAWDTIPENFTIHSLHSYFILACNMNIPVTYSVETIRDGRSIATRTVKALQKERTIFICNFSFTRLDKGINFNHQDDMPLVPDPNTLPSDLDLLQTALSNTSQIPPELKKKAQKRLRDLQPIDYRSADKYTFEELVTGNIKPTSTQRRWFKSRAKLGDDMKLHACAIAWASDNEIISTAGAANGYTFLSEGIGMLATLDHTIWFHVPVRADEWLLYDIHSPRTSHGRGVVFGKIYTKDGVLVASTTQEVMLRLSASEQEKFQKAQDIRKEAPEMSKL